MKTILEFIYQQIKPVLAGSVIAAAILFIGQYAGTPAPEGASLQKKITYSTQNLINLATNTLNPQRQPASVEQSIKVSQHDTSSLSKINKHNNSPAPQPISFGKMVDEQPDSIPAEGSLVDEAIPDHLTNTSAPDKPTQPTAEEQPTPSLKTSHTESPSFGIGNSTQQITTSSEDNTTQDSVPTNSQDISGSSSVSLTVNADKTSGYFSGEFQVTLSANIENATIHYCLSSTTTCCDPFGSEGQEYSSPITIGSTDGQYCLSALATCSPDQSSLAEYQFTVDGTLPDATQDIAVIQLQSTEQSLLEFSSSDMGSDGFTLTQLNLKDNDPSSKQCSELLSSYSTDSYGVLEDLIQSSELDMGGGRAPASVFNFSLSQNNLQYGDNYLVSIVENSNPEDGSLYSCPATKVILKDFEIYGSEVAVGDQNLSGSNGSILTGGFAAFGGFGTAVNQAVAGREKQTSSKYLETGFINITN